ncbi:hypothetical protein NDU88_008195 [Pleurodeles waltl]|uniref:Uncharacterized protein n=1 Tax=Pleurodeles waltl TaxID=8319 RepID=A0AAV7VUS1_PLEWA|nr:hypothetical protein NDU88_008195 [Pleurodeles waltl]
MPNLHHLKFSPCDRPDWADPHNAPACSATSPPDPDEPSRSSNRGVPWPSQLEFGCIKGLLSLPEESAIGSGAGKTKTTEEKKEEDEDDRSSTDMSGRASGCAELFAPSKGCGQKERSRKPVVPFRVEGDRLRGARCEYPPHFRISVAEAGAWDLPEQG